MQMEAELLPPKVLVVDANVRHCMLYRMEMEAQGYEVVCAHNGQDAMQQLQQRRFDIAVIDVILPDISGIDLVEQILTTRQRPQGRHLPIIINTAYPYFPQQSRRWFADAYILKSSNLDELMGKITSFLQRDRRRNKPKRS
ncbi:MAG: response regulator [candidate division KSB1 bacterium]|nr:response regulator [candidate division KSB1 bacterium]MDZ7366943.1 response regulator [candidate division KSB1 bacterium]MDZ7406828.1 response regulator [candidate division KSB1 bacterium]